MTTTDLPRRVLKWTVALDDREHPIGSGPVVLVGIQENAGRAAVTVWTIEDGEPILRPAQVYGTGWTIPPEADHVGSVQDGRFVWHVFAAPHAKTQGMAATLPEGMNLQCPACGRPIEAVTGDRNVDRNPKVKVLPCRHTVTAAALGITL